MVRANGAGTLQVVILPASSNRSEGAQVWGHHESILLRWITMTANSPGKRGSELGDLLSARW